MLIDNQHIILSDACMMIYLIYLCQDDSILWVALTTSLYSCGTILQVLSTYIKRDIFTNFFFCLSYTLKIISQWVTYQLFKEYMLVALIQAQLLFITIDLKKLSSQPILMIFYMALFLFQFEGVIENNIKLIINLGQIVIFSLWLLRVRRSPDIQKSEISPQLRSKYLASIEMQVQSESLKNKKYFNSVSTRRINLTNNSLLFDDKFELIETHINFQELLTHQSQSDQAFEILLNLKLNYFVDSELQSTELRSAALNMEYDQQTLFLIEKNEYIKFENRVVLINCLNFEGARRFQLQFFELPVQSPQNLDDTLEIDMCRSLSHELGTNLNSILTYTKMALKDDLVEVQTKSRYLNAIKINCEQLNLIVGTIRDFNLINLKQFSLKLEELDIEEEIRFIVSLFADSIESKAIKIEYNLDLQSQLLVNDKIRFRQVLFQLLQNAIKYSFQSQITINLVNDNLECFISIIDNGVGLSESEAENINCLLQSNKFIRVSEQSVGVGLGLGISNQLVKQMSGKNNSIQLIRKSKGCQFSFWVKNHQLEISREFMRKQSSGLKRSSQTIRFITINTYFEDQVQSSKISIRKTLLQKMTTSQQMPIPKKTQILESRNASEEDSFCSIRPPVLSPKFQQSIVQCSLKSNCCSRVLIVDDEYFNIQCLMLLLTKFGSKCDSAFNGKEAIQQVLNKKNTPCKICGNRFYSLIFLDINMPILDGYKTVQELKKMMRESIINKAWCVANTGFCDLDTKIKSYDAGMDYFLTKPLDHQELKDMLGTMFPFFDY